MAGADDVPKPPDDYEMSDDFRAWLVDRMRADVMAQVNRAGLDRVAIVRSGDADEPGEAEEGGAGADSGDGPADEPA